MANRTAEKTEACAAALRRHRFEAEVVKDAEAAFALMKAVVEAENPQLVSFGDSMTMRGTGIVEWLRSNGRLTLLDGFDASKPYEERLEIRRRALLSDLFITGVNAVTEQGTLHWLDKVGNRIAPVAFGPRKVIIVAGRNKIVADRDEAEERIRRIAICPGSGSSLAPEAAAAGADLLITGDVKYHAALEFPLPVLDVGHFSLEEEMMRRFALQLKEQASDVAVQFVPAQDPLAPFFPSH